MTQPAGAAIDHERRAGLNAAKLAALVRTQFGEAPRDRHAFATGAALTERSTDGIVAYVLVDGEQSRGLGPALAWAARHGASALHVVAEPPAAATLSFLAREFADGPEVWAVDGTALAPATASHGESIDVDALHTDEHAALVDLLLDAGVEVLVEGGIVRGEVEGLEVARIVHGDDGPQLEVGVGKADRELTAMLHGALAPTDQLARVVDIVRTHRRAGAPPHPLNQLAKERWIRARLVDDPGRIGLTALAPADWPAPRPNLRATWIAPAVGVDAAGAPVVVVCSVGIDLDLVPAAAGARAAIDPSARLVLVVPERDDHPVTRSLATRLREPAEVVTLSGDWRA